MSIIFLYGDTFCRIFLHQLVIAPKILSRRWNMFSAILVMMSLQGRQRKLIKMDRLIPLSSHPPLFSLDSTFHDFSQFYWHFCLKNQAACFQEIFWTVSWPLIFLGRKYFYYILPRKNLTWVNRSESELLKMHSLLN